MLSLLALLALPALATPADDPMDDALAEQRIERLTEKLGVTEPVAIEIVVLFEEHRAEIHAHREAIAQTAKALKQARTDGDTGATKRRLKELLRLIDEAQDIGERHQDAVMSLLTVEQQADWLLFRLHRRATKHAGGLPTRPH